MERLLGATERQTQEDISDLIRERKGGLFRQGEGGECRRGLNDKKSV